jgi:predicted phage terminase large subunit-like protein
LDFEPQVSRETAELIYRTTFAQNPYLVGQSLFPKQFIFLTHPARELLYGGGARGGKALQVDTLIPTPAGWKKMGDLSAGDEVFSEDGSICRVLIAHDSSVVDGYKLRFDDGSEIVSSADHLWCTYTKKQMRQMTRFDPEWRSRRRAVRARRVSGRKSAAVSTYVSEPIIGSVKSTRGIAGTLVVRRHNNHAISVCGSLDCLPEAELPIDPYVLGCWSGDGDTDSAGFTSGDEFIVDQIRAAGWPVRKVKAEYRWVVGELVNGWRRDGRRGLVNTFATELRRLGVLGNKHIPAAYLRGSRSQRLSLLQGLMDTDGMGCKSGSVEFTNTNRLLSEAVAELACSLGHKAVVRQGWATLNGHIIGPEWNVKWTAHDPVFRLPRKLSRQTTTPRRTTRFRYIVSCDPVPPELMRCITVDSPSGMFLCGRSMIPTHNSRAIIYGALQYAFVPNYKACIVRRSLPDLKQSGGIIEQTAEILRPHANKKMCWYNATENYWSFSNGARLDFKHLADSTDLEGFQGGMWQYIGIDELTQIPMPYYQWLIGNRQSKGIYVRGSGAQVGLVPLRMRATANPGGRSHTDVYNWFINPKTRRPDVDFIQSLYTDNPWIDHKSYGDSLAKLDRITHRQLALGDWTVTPSGGIFYQKDFEYRYERHGGFYKLGGKLVAVADCIRFASADIAGTEKTSEEAQRNNDPDFTVIGVWDRTPDGELLLIHLWKGRQNIPEVEEKLCELYSFWNVAYAAVEKNGIGLPVVQAARRRGLAIRAVLAKTNKEARCQAASILFDNGQVWLPQSAPWLEDLISEMLLFPQSPKDDQCDMVSIACQQISKSLEPRRSEPEKKIEADAEAEEAKLIRQKYDEDASHFQVTADGDFGWRDIL